VKMTAKDNTMPTMPKEDTKNPDEWQVKNWAQTLTDGEAIKQDPHKMRHVHKHLKKMHKAIGKIVSVQGLRDKAKEMEGSPGEESGEAPAKETKEKAKGID
jgi:hypothetical protein